MEVPSQAAPSQERPRNISFPPEQDGSMNDVETATVTESQVSEQTRPRAGSSSTPTSKLRGSNEDTASATSTSAKKPRKTIQAEDEPEESSESENEFEDVMLHMDKLPHSTTKRLRRFIMHMARVETRLGTIEERLNTDQKTTESQASAASTKASKDHGSDANGDSRTGTKAYQERFPWEDKSPNAKDDPDPRLSWEELLAFYSTNLETSLGETNWNSIMEDQKQSQCVLEVPVGKWQEWNEENESPHTINHTNTQPLSNVRHLPDVNSYQRKKSTTTPIEYQAVRVNSIPVLRELRRITQKRISQGVLVAPFKEFWWMSSTIMQTLQELHNQAFSSDEDISILPIEALPSNDDVITTSSPSPLTEERLDGVKNNVAITYQKESDTGDKRRQDRVNLNQSTSERFAKLKAKAKATVTYHEFEYVVSFLNSQIEPSKIAHDIAKDQEDPEVEFSDLWKYFAPGTMALSIENGHRQVLRILNATGGQPVLDAESSSKKRSRRTSSPERKDIASFNTNESSRNFTKLVLDCYCIDHNGKRFGAVMKHISIDAFSGKQRMSSLLIFPLEYSSQKDREEVFQRGEKFRDLAQTVDKDKIPHKMYNGLTLGKSAEEVESPIVIDLVRAAEIKPEMIATLEIKSSDITTQDASERITYTIVEYVCGQRSCRSPGCREHKKKPIGDVDDDECLARAIARMDGSLQRLESVRGADLNNDEIMLLPYKIVGFVLRRRDWATLNIDLIGELDDPGSKAFGHLVLPRGHRELVENLVWHHLDEKNQILPEKSLARNMDPVKGKGNGLVILLHGEPGVGKTSTVEAMALKTKRPLYPITCGDLGENAEQVEDQLNRTFQNAHRWSCILLLDEADIFLSRRTKTDLKRNALVSVFLRTLEYYGGILFLTTHRVGVLDDAFKSRIRLSLYYPSLDLRQTEKIFTKQISRIKKHDKNATIDKEDILEFAAEHYQNRARNRDSVGQYEGWWNGRQIRNAFQTAIALASFDDTGRKMKKLHLTADHFERVALTTGEFEDYMKRTHGGLTDGERASDAYERALDFAVGAAESWRFGSSNNQRFESRLPQASRSPKPASGSLLSPETSGDPTGSVELTQVEKRLFKNMPQKQKDVLREALESDGE